MLFRLALTSGGSSSPHETMVGAIRRHKLTGVLEVAIPVRFARITGANLDSLLRGRFHDGIDGGLSGTITDAEHDGVLVGANNVSDVVEHKFFG